MPRQKRSSLALEKAERRAASLKSINPALNLGDGLTLESYVLQIEGLRHQLASYNESLSFADRALSTCKTPKNSSATCRSAC